MNNHTKTNFDERAATWEKPQQINLANGVADTMIRELKLSNDMNVMDYGCGSGLVTMRLQPMVKSIVGVDSSTGMLDVFQEKINNSGFKNVSCQLANLEDDGSVEGKFNLIVSSMAFHHVNKIPLLLERLYDLLFPGGSIGIADLDKEDGTFHSDNSGVVHFGFERNYLKTLFEQAGFRDIKDVTATKVVKEVEGKGICEFPVFLMTGRK
jgi:ubiquinone/menaquinone biosynthesis C-methylase UbiE